VTFPVSAEVPGRWLRIVVKSLNGAGGYGEIMEFRAFGDRLTNTPPPNVTGTYKTADHEDFLYLTQTGTQVSGCYSHGLVPLLGGMEGRLLKYSYQISDDDKGPAIAVFSSDGSVFDGRWKMTGVAAEHPRLSPMEYKKESDKPGKCPNEKKPEDQLASDLKQNGRVRLYGINFDSDSATIRDESKPTLDIVASMLKENPDFKITIEGHTDSTSTPEHNQQLSESRANAVKAYLAGAGVDVARLTAAGFGATKPVATNDSALGRAENRRVELARS
jgi:OOP family OmpA-OmpF porin